MTWMSTRTKIILSGGIVAGLALVAVVNFTGVCRLHAVTLNEEPLEDWSQRYSMLSNAPLVRQPLGQLADSLLAADTVCRVEVRPGGLHELDIYVNRFVPACLLLDSESGVMYGLDRQGRILPLDNAEIDWERPILIGLEAGPRFELCRHPLVTLVMDELEELRDEHHDFYRLIDQIRFDDEGCVTVAVTGLGYTLRVSPRRLAGDLDRYLDFATRYNPDLDSITMVDLRFEDMIITREEG